MSASLHYYVFFFNDTATTEIYTLSLHDALPISSRSILPHASIQRWGHCAPVRPVSRAHDAGRTASGWCSHALDRKSTRLNSSHANISYAVFCLKKKTTHYTSQRPRSAHSHICTP